MISFPFRSPRSATIDALYGMIVAQARAPAFYASYRVPDTVAGRLDMIVLHMVLVRRRLAFVGAANTIGRPLFDRFCQDIDDNFREMGVGDLAVPKQMRRVAEAFYGRTKAYERALRSEDAVALPTALARNVFGDPRAPLGAQRLAAYMQETARRLDEYDAGAFARAEFAFPDPETITERPGRPEP